MSHNHSCSCEHHHEHNHEEHCHEHHHHEHGGHEHHHDHEHGSSKLVLARIIIAALAVVAMQFLPIEGYPRLACFIAIYLFIGWGTLKEAVENIFHGEVFDENFLMVVATIGAFALAIIEGSGDYNEAIAVMLFFQIGEFFEGYAVGKSRKSISELMDIRPDYANIEKDGQLEKVDPETVAIGTIVVVQPGERVPLDGIVTEGYSTLNTSALTGESLPRDINKGEEIVSGCINMTGVLKVKTTKLFGDSTVSKILELVENSDNNKSESEAFITRFARYYTPIVCYCALALAIIPTIVQTLMDCDDITTLFTIHYSLFTIHFKVWLYRALTFLVISCPCALVISIPLSFFAGIGGASHEGILIKGSNFLEILAKLKTVVFDKTGTLTLGVFEVNAIHDGEDKAFNERHIVQHANTQHPASITQDKLLELAAYVECSSTHPIAKSIVKKYSEIMLSTNSSPRGGREGALIDHSRVSDIQEIGGHGITAKVDGITVAAGNEKLMRQLGLDYCHCQTAGTIVHMAVDGHYAGHIVMGDVVRPNSKEAIAALHQAGVTRTVMLTGDNAPVAKQVADALNIDEVHSDLLPGNKVEELEKIMGINNSLPLTGGPGWVSFVGDGINDAPVLTRADLGIAMGAMGSDAAIEAADVVLMDDDPMKISKAIRIARKTLSIVWQNIIFAIGIKVICLILSAFGLANMWLAVFADVGVLILAVLNAMRAMYVRKV